MSKQVGDAQIIGGNCVRLDINFRISGDGRFSQDGEIVAIYAPQDRDVAIEGGKVTSGCEQGSEEVREQQRQAGGCGAGCEHQISQDGRPG
ncbi:hypothetical protein ACE04B_27790, partial [Rhizobium phaseoli]